MLPAPRGDLTEALLRTITKAPAGQDLTATMVRRAAAEAAVDVLADEDLQLALYLCYELHYRGLPGVEDAWEWNPDLLGLRAQLEARFLRGLREAVPPPPAPPMAQLTPEQAAAGIDLELRSIAGADDGPSLSQYIRGRAGLDQVREFLVHRSAYQLKEADPHSWALPRLSGVPKAAMVEIQYDEYGGGRSERIHAALFAQAMRAVGLEDAYGAYLDLIPGVTLATVNLMSMFGLHRRWRGAIVGHLAMFEMTSSIPNRRYGQGLRRLGLGSEATLFFDEHVTADAVHENIASVDLAGGLLRQEPQLRESLLWGARALAHVEGRWGAHLLARWAEGATSLLRPLQNLEIRGAAPQAVLSPA